MRVFGKGRRLACMMLVMCLFTVSCGRQSDKRSYDEVSDDSIKIGFSIDSLVVERWEKDRDVFVTRAQELGATVNIQNASGDFETQRKQIDYLIDKGVDVIVIVAADSEGFANEVEKAHKKGIRVVAYDRMLMNTDVDLYISFDNEKVGELMAETFKKKLTRGSNVMMVNGPTTDNNVAYVSGGFNKIAAEEGWNITDVSYTEGWKQELAYEYINSHLNIAEEADAIMCGNDAIAGQVIKALTENRIKKDIYVSGQDADLDACQRVVEKTQYMTVYKPIDTLAKTAAEYSVKLVTGEELPDIKMVNNGAHDIPCFYVTPYAVTIDNIDEMIIDSGFHMKNEVYLNVPQ